LAVPVQGGHEEEGHTLKPLRFLQFSDAHLDSSLGSSKLNLPQNKRRELRADIMKAMHRLPGLVDQYDVEVVLCPGDLWEDEAVLAETASEVFEIFASLQVPVIIAPGNHDFYHPLSYYSREHFSDILSRTFPDNVHVFTQAEMRALELPEWRSDVTFYGLCYTAAAQEGVHPAFAVREVDPEKINVALVHGSLIDVPVFAEDKAKRNAAQSFSTDDILASPYDYVALGHYHAYSDCRGAEGRIRAAYGGIPVARGLDETEDHFIVVGEIAKGGVAPASLELVSVDPHRIMKLEVELDPTVDNPAKIVQRIREAIKTAGAGRQDIVYAALCGEVSPSFKSYQVDERDFEKDCWHIAIDWKGVAPGYDLDALRSDVAAAKTVIGQFVARLDQLEQEAEAAGDAARAELVREARIFGLDALHGKELRLRYALE